MDVGELREKLMYGTRAGDDDIDRSVLREPAKLVLQRPRGPTGLGEVEYGQNAAAKRHRRAVKRLMGHIHP